LGRVEQQLVAGLAIREQGDPAEPGILLWPGLGATGAYWASIAARLPGRAVAVDPPGWAGSPRMDPCTYERMVQAACAVVDRRGCRAIVGHSLGGYVAIGVAATRPAELRAAVLIDGGFMDARQMTEIGLPVAAPRADLTAWLRDNDPRFPDWETAAQEMAAMLGSEQTPEFDAYLREVFAEQDGEICERAAPEVTADALLAVFDPGVRVPTAAIAVPTLLIACGQPAERRATRQSAWQRLAALSPLIETQVAEDWGHNPVLQDPAGSSKLIGDWLRRHL
jgi:pimeloyl-ACP methyl ester carboxylesterase